MEKIPYMKVVATDSALLAAQQGKIFTKLFAPQMPKKKAGGNGLGLYIVEAIVGSNGGTIGLVGRKQRQTFHIDLPESA